MSNYAPQSEILFLWDIENANPNGDILRDNAPRYDDIAHKALVSDVRIKRTIRDDIYDRKNQEIFVREEKSIKGGIVDAKERGFNVIDLKEDEYRKMLKVSKTDNKTYANYVENFLNLIDVRAFGAVIPSYGKFDKNEKKSHLQSINLTGSIQFKMTKSLHQTNEPTFNKHTGGFASEAGAESKTFAEEYYLPYALFGTYGVVNALNSKNTKLSDNDVTEVVDSLWKGTKNLITRSKMGQLPRFLLKITYKEAGFFIGELDNKVALSIKTASESEIRSTQDYDLDLSIITDLLDKYAQKIEKIEYAVDDTFEAKITIPENWKKIELD